MKRNVRTMGVTFAIFAGMVVHPTWAVASEAATGETCSSQGIELLSTNASVDAKLLSIVRGAITEREDSVYLNRTYSTDEVWATIRCIHNEDPIFYFDSATVWRYDDDSVSHVEFKYLFGAEELPEAKQRYEQAVQEALKWTSVTMSGEETCKALNDYLVRSTTYDYDDYKNGTIPAISYSPYGALVNRTAVCTGYSRAYVDLLRRCGIEARVVSSEEMHHSWVVVTLNGKNYHVDPTFNDPVYPDGTDGGWGREPSSDYFLKSDQAFVKLDHYGWDSGGIVCDDTSKDNLDWPVYSGPVRPYYGFKDLGRDVWYLPAVEYGIENRLVSGYSEERFGPNDALTRAQAAVIISRILAPSGTIFDGAQNRTGMRDVEPGSWYCGAVNWCVSQGVLKGDGKAFRPNDPITREELCVLLERASIKQTMTIWPYSDAILLRILALPESEQPSEWAKSAVLVMATQGVIGNGPQLNLHAAATRCEALQMIANAESAQMLFVG